MKNALQVFPSPPLTCRLSIFIVSSLVVSCHGEHVDVKVFILFLSSLRILLLIIFECFGENRYERKSSGAGRCCLSESCMVVQIQGKYHDSGSWSSTKTFDDQSTKLTQTCFFCMFFCDQPPDLQHKTELKTLPKYIYLTPTSLSNRTDWNSSKKNLKKQKASTTSPFVDQQ